MVIKVVWKPQSIKWKSPVDGCTSLQVLAEVGRRSCRMYTAGLEQATGRIGKELVGPDKIFPSKGLGCRQFWVSCVLVICASLMQFVQWKNDVSLPSKDVRRLRWKESFALQMRGHMCSFY